MLVHRDGDWCFLDTSQRGMTSRPDLERDF